MRICAIYNVWADWDLLEHSVKNMEPLVDGIIIIASEYSNYWSRWPIPARWKDKVFLLDPVSDLQPMDNERRKRNWGLEIAKKTGYTHFIMMDADEFYEPEAFLKEKDKFLNQDLNGLVCGCQVYFKSPTLTIGIENTRVTFIHKITTDLKFEWNRNFPFAWDEKRQIRIDPTRQLNINSGVEWSDIIMHHYSWVRRDINIKIQNSTAKSNILRSTVVQDFSDAKEGYYCQFYQRKLARCPNLFGLPEM